MLLAASNDAEGNVLWLTTIFGGTPRKVRIHSDSPAISPQGSSIAFISGGGHEIWTAGPNGENATKVRANESETYTGLAWSPSGKRLAYLKLAADQRGGSIETFSLEGGAPSGVLSDPRLMAHYELLWLANGRMLYDMRGSSIGGLDVWSIAADPKSGKAKGELRKITNSDEVLYENLSVTSDLRNLVLVKAHDRGEVYVGELKDAGTVLDSPKALTVTGSRNYPTAWMSGEVLLISSTRTGRSQMFKQFLGQDTAEALSPGPDEQAWGEPTPDGKWILYFSLGHYGGSLPSSVRLMRVVALPD